MIYSKPVLYSILVHILALIFLSQEQSHRVPPDQKPGGNSSEEGKYQSNGSDQKFKPGKENGKIVSVAPGLGKDKCRKWFGGIGITYDGIATITEVFKGYPAAKAGMQVGDYIWNISVITGDVDTPVTFSYSRAGHFHTVTMIRAKICTLE